MKLALCGKMRTGKGTIAEMLWQEYGFVELTFAEPIKAMAQKYFPRLCAEGKPRELLQFIGHGFRQFDNDVWVNAMAKEVKFLTYGFRSNQVIFDEQNEPNLVISDLRYQNEAEWCRENGFIIIKILATRETQIERALKTEPNFVEDVLDDPSELDIDKIEALVEIPNNGTIQEFKTSVRGVLNLLGVKECVPRQ